MTGQQLKNSILQMAIQGKLVPQDPHDEPASVLLERIREEKKRLVKEGKIKVDKNESIIYRDDDCSYFEKANKKVICIDEEIPFELPNNWRWERWGNISLSIQYGYNAPAEPSGDIKMVRISDIQDNQVIWPTVPYCTIPNEDIDTYLLQPNDILFARTGGTVGKSFLVNEVPEPSIYAGYLIRTRYSNSLNPKYMKYFMESELYWSQLRSGTIATAQPNCNGKTLSRMFIPVPPQEEQRRIVEKLESLMPLIESYGKSQEALNALNASLPEKLRQSILQEAIQGHLVPQDPNEEPASVLLERIRAEKAWLVKEGKLKKKDLEEKPISPDEIPFDIPEGWVWCRLGDYNEIITGSTPSKSNPEFFGKDYPFYKPGDLISKFIINSDDGLSTVGYNQTRKLPKDSILVCCIGSLGKSSIIKREGSCNQQINAILPSQIFIVDYLYYSINSPYFVQEMWNKSASTTVTILNKANFSDILIPLPPLSEQRRIVTKLEELLQEIDKLKA